MLSPRAGDAKAPFQLRNARSVKRNLPVCQLRTSDVELRWKGRTAMVRADAGPLAISRRPGYWFGRRWRSRQPGR